MLLGDGQVADASPWIDVGADFLEQAGGFGAHPAELDQTEATWLSTQQNVLRDREVVDQIQFLMDHDHPDPAGVVDVSRLVWNAVEGERTLVRGLDSRENLHQRALTGTVLPDHSMHFACSDVQAHAIQRADRRELLGDVSDFEHRKRIPE